MPSIDRQSSVPYYHQVYEQIARGIESGVYPAGKKLPSIRECARELAVSNTTIELAYQRLSEEGYVQARRGSGYIICQVGGTIKREAVSFSEEYLQTLGQLEALETADSPQVLFDFNYDATDESLFPYNAWARISREVLFSKGAEATCLYNDCQGLPELREQIAHYVEREYGVRCSGAQVLVMPTTRSLVTEIMGLFDPTATTVVMEEPGYDEVAGALVRTGFNVKAVPMFPFPSFQESEPYLEGARIVFTTPSSQFPTNEPMPMALRQQLIEWAQREDAYLIDDEYGWEFQSGIERKPALASLDQAGRVITLGTFSNSFTPAICLSYAILPPQLMLQWRKAKRDAHPCVPWQTQASMAAFMREDHWRTHVRKLRTAMLKKRELLMRALAKHMGDEIEILEGSASLFVLVQTRDGRSEDELIAAAAEAGVRVHPTRRYWNGEVPEGWRYVLVGYSGIEQGNIDRGIHLLAQAWGLA